VVWAAWVDCSKEGPDVAALLPEPIQFGKYTLFERIGRGGMAEVYKGRIQGPAGFERTFVVKRILPHLSEDPTFIKMFVEEAKLSARLNHPNIVQIFELGAVESEYFISMEYIRGRDLAETMRAIWKTMGPPRPELVAYIGREACRALSYAHSLTDDAGRLLGMIHRDVSPSNIMLSYEGSVKLLDFGIAKALGEAPAETTKSGTMKGKYAYMAPEQTEGDDVDSRIDIFSCGIVLHEVLTGRRLFKGNNDIQTIERVRRCEVPPPSFQNPMCPPELDNVVLRALARNRADRFTTAAEMADALDDVVHASRFQPGHLAQLLHDLFPIDGGGSGPPERRPPTTYTSSNPSGTGSGMSASAARSPTIQPVTRSTPFGGAGLAGEAPVQLRKGRSGLKVLGALAVLAVGGVILWKGVAAKAPLETGRPAAAAFDPARRFNIYVKSEPPGADIFVDNGVKPVGATPISLPIDLNGVSSVRMVLKKPGYEDYQQIVTTDSPISINLQPIEAPPAAAAPPAPPPTPPPPPAAPSPAADDDGAGDRGAAAKSKRRGGASARRVRGKPDKDDQDSTPHEL
jgi:serine/threonine-protein kinase